MTTNPPKTRQERLAEEIASSREWRAIQRAGLNVIPGTATFTPGKNQKRRRGRRGGRR